MFWHDKTSPGVVFMDCREVPPGVDPVRPNFAVMPDFIGDFRSMPFADATFRLVVFDPPHLVRRDLEAQTRSHMGIRYGALHVDTWRDDIKAGFRECLRVLDPAGFLIFKWAESSVKASEVLKLAPHAPLFGTRTGKSGATHWLTFAQHPSAGVIT